MTNGDRIRTFSNEQLALILMCAVDACLTTDCEPIQIKKDNDKCNASQINVRRFTNGNYIRTRCNIQNQAGTRWLVEHLQST